MGNDFWGLDKRYVLVHGKKCKFRKLKLKLNKKNIKSMLDVIGLSNLTDLRELELKENDIKKIEGLEALTHLEKLDLWGNEITEIEGLDNLRNLKELNLSFNNIHEIKGLNNLKRLEHLELYSNRITEMKGLEKLENLYFLNLGSNQISEIKGLNHLGKNQKAKIKNNPLSIHLKEFKFLSLDYNKITKIEGIESLKDTLYSLDLSHNPLVNLKGLEILENLKVLNIPDIEIFSKEKYNKKSYNSYEGLILQDIIRYCKRKYGSNNQENKEDQGKEASENGKKNVEVDLTVTDPYEFINNLGKKVFRDYKISRNTSYNEIHDIYRELCTLIHPDKSKYISNKKIMQDLNVAFQKIKKEKNGYYE